MRASEQRSCWYQPGWDEKHLRRLHLFREFEPSLNAGHISLYYQPKISVIDFKVVGMEGRTLNRTDAEVHGFTFGLFPDYVTGQPSYRGQDAPRYHAVTAPEQGA